MEFAKYVELPKLLATKVLEDLKGRTDLL
jgi:hypothetical protein